MSLKVYQSVSSASNRFQCGEKKTVVLTSSCALFRFFSSVFAPVFLHKGVCVCSFAQPPPTLSSNDVLAAIGVIFAETLQMDSN